VAFCVNCVFLPCSSSKTRCEHVHQTLPLSSYSDTDSAENAPPCVPTKTNLNVNVCSHTPDNHVNLSIGSLNVCGLKTKSNYPEFQELISNYDILCTQETKLDKFDKIDIPNYTFLSKPRLENYKRKSGGLGYFIKNEIMNKLSVTTPESKCEYIFWLKISNGQENVTIGNVYIPPEQSRFHNDDELFLLENEIANTCTQFDNILLTGDFNGYTSNLPDYTDLDNFLSQHFQIDGGTMNACYPSQILTQLGIPLQRNSQCNKTNKTGHKLLEICKFNNLIIMNGRFGKDSNIGKHTFRNTSVIDYALSSINLLYKLNEFEIIDVDGLLSDGHSLLSITVNLPFDVTLTPIPEINTKNTPRPPKWNPNKQNDFVSNIDNTEINEIQELLNNRPNNDIKTFLNKITNKISNIFLQSARKSFPHQINKQRSKTSYLNFRTIHSRHTKYNVSHDTVP